MLPMPIIPMAPPGMPPPPLAMARITISALPA